MVQCAAFHAHAPTSGPVAHGTSLVVVPTVVAVKHGGTQMQIPSVGHIFPLHESGSVMRGAAVARSDIVAQAVGCAIVEQIIGSQEVEHLHLLPSVEILILHAAQQRGGFGQLVFARSYRASLQMPRKVVDHRILPDAVAVGVFVGDVFLHDGVEIDMPSGILVRNDAAAAVGAHRRASATACNRHIHRVFHRKAVAVLQMLKCEIRFEIVVAPDGVFFAIQVAPVL